MTDSPFATEETPDFLTTLYALRSAIGNARKQALQRQATQRRGLGAAADLAAVEETLSDLIRSEDAFAARSP